MQTPHFATNVFQRKLRHEFDRNSIQRGLDYFLQRAVTNLNISDYSAQAEVIGTYIYRTELSWIQVTRTAKLSAKCTCPHFNDGYFCKHLWAMILELDRRGLPSNILLPSHVELVMNHGRVIADATDASSAEVENLNSDVSLNIDSQSQISKDAKSNWRSVFRLRYGKRKIKQRLLIQKSFL